MRAVEIRKTEASLGFHVTLGGPPHFCVHVLGEPRADWCFAGHRGVKSSVRAAVVVVKA